MWSCRSCRNELLSPPKTVAKVTESLWRGPNNDRFMIYMHVAYRKYIHVNNPLTTIQPVILRILYISDKEYLFLLAWHIRFFMLLMSASIVMFNTSINFNVQFTSWCHIYNFCELKCYKNFRKVASYLISGGKQYYRYSVKFIIPHLFQMLEQKTILQI